MVETFLKSVLFWVNVIMVLEKNFKSTVAYVSFFQYFRKARHD